jgi:hypothetical protein
MKKSAAKFDYDVAFSFAGEDRKCVEQIAEILHQIGIRIFYDKYERADLWGRDLYVHLDDVYRNKSRFCVLFISKHYKRKLWANHERESAQARAFKTRGEYILPVRLDDTKIPGVRSTRGYIDLREVSADEVAHLIVKKLGKSAEIQSMISYLKHELGDYEITIDGSDLKFTCASESYEGSFPIRLMLEMYRTNNLWDMFILPGIVPV